MPRYEYFCPDNGQSLVVRHGRSEAIHSWGELCQAASAEIGSTPGDAVVEQRSQAHSGCASGCDCHGDHHDHANNSRISWLSSRLGRATSKGLGCGLLSVIIFTPCPCCGGVILACLRGLLSAAIGLGVGVVAYRRRSDTATSNRFVDPSDAALERK